MIDKNVTVGDVYVDKQGRALIVRGVRTVTEVTLAYPDHMAFPKIGRIRQGAIDSPMFDELIREASPK